MFIGQSLQAIDSKGRLSIPSKFREILNSKYGGKLILTYLQPYIVAYPTEEWMRIEERLGQPSMIQKEIGDLIRLIYSYASECTLDNQGRILIPPTLREFAAIQRDVAVLGIRNKIEIWSKDRWDEFKEGVKEKVKTLPDKLMEIGFL
ncbi:MAG: division/cell wall cluster transcriptional repressor MraZ [Nitrospinae bacterium]|nr:division/cell wall cluster transcriptional repressor MraZ [Nitrospinota bacterium]MBI3815236.1 division/cell wall cluster transcriptional repressor MraZ [Nitrospinota bacterium]